MAARCGGCRFCRWPCWRAPCRRRSVRPKRQGVPCSSPRPGWWPPSGGCSSPCMSTAACLRRWPLPPCWRLRRFWAATTRWQPGAGKGCALLGGRGGGCCFSPPWRRAGRGRGGLWTGFPWGAGGYAHVEGPLSVLPRWIGVYGTGAVAAWLAYGLAYGLAALLDRQGLRPVRLVATAAALVLAWGGLWWLRDAAINAPSAERPALSVALLQGNIPQDEKFEAGSGIPLALGWYGRELRAATAQLVVAPETAVPLLPQQLPEEYRSEERRVGKECRSRWSPYH